MVRYILPIISRIDRQLLSAAERSAYRNIQASGLFDAEFYLRTYSKVARLGSDPLRHFVRFGESLGFNPNAHFDTSFYARAYPDVVAHGMNTFEHYLKFGESEGRQQKSPLGFGQEFLANLFSIRDFDVILQSGLFDVEYYTLANPDVTTSSIHPIVHYLTSGAGEGRDPAAFFSTNYYLANNEDVRNNALNPFLHFVTFGKNEGRRPADGRLLDDRVEASGPLYLITQSPEYALINECGLFDSEYYLLTNDDVSQAKIDPLAHFLTSGWREGRSPHALFDVMYYIEKYALYIGHDLCPLTHYIQHSRSSFDPNAYFDNAWYVDQHESRLEGFSATPLEHYILRGSDEGRAPSPRFDAEYYLEKNGDVRAAGIDPLAHFLLSGQLEGRPPRAPDIGIERCDPLEIPFEVWRDPGPLAGHDTCIYMTHSANGLVSNHVFHCLRALKSADFKTVIVMAVDAQISPLEKFDAIDGLIIRANHGWDFAAWAAAIAIFPDVWNSNSVLLMNDSVVGPIYPDFFRDVKQRAEASNADIFALTDSYQVNHHLMSYFSVISKSGLKHKAILKFWNNVKSLREKEEVIKRYELKSTGEWEQEGVTTGVLYATDPSDAPAINPTLHRWKDLINNGFPFLKLQLLREKIEGVDNSGWEEYLTQSGNENLLDDLQSYLEHARGRSGRILKGDRTQPHLRLSSGPIPRPNRRFCIPRVLKNDHGAINAVRLKEESDLALEVPFYSIEKRNVICNTIAAVVHIFHVDLLEGIIQYIQNVPAGVDLYVSTDNFEKKRQIEASLCNYLKGAVVVCVFPNIGRDIAPLIVGFRNVFEEYEYILHIHSKKSMHDERYGQWRGFLLENLLGSVETVSSILSLLNRSVGIVFSAHFPPINNLINWGHNFSATKNLLLKMNVELSADHRLEFPSSSFFWARSSALRPLLQLGMNWSDFEQESGQVDGTLAHAIERSLLYVCERAGYRWVKVCTARNASGKAIDALCRVNDGSSLDLDIHRVYRPLLGNIQTDFRQRSKIPELVAVDFAPSFSERPRLNLVLPTLEPKLVFGGIATAVRIFEELASHLGTDFDRRIISLSKIDIEAMKAFPDYIHLPLGYELPSIDRIILDVSDQGSGEVSLRKNDVFIATAWWTMYACSSAQETQQRFFSNHHIFVYLIQDNEPSFYNNSSHSLVAADTYAKSERFLALINSEELANFMIESYAIKRSLVIPYKPNPQILGALKRLPRERIILIYGRPSVARNGFAILCQGIKAWQSNDPDLALAWRVVSVGEDFDPKVDSTIRGLEVLGKLALIEYADLLSRASIGISLMISPHPSYPPLEMAQAGMITLTNRFAYKDLKLRSDKIRDIDPLSASGIATALAGAVRDAESLIGQLSVETAVRDVSCEIDSYNPSALAEEILSSILS